MNRITKYIFAAAITALSIGSLTSCADDTIRVPDTGNTAADCEYSFTEQGYLELPVNIEIPGMSTAAPSRALDETPDFSSLNLYVLVFEENEGLKQYLELESFEHTTDETHGHEYLVPYKIILEPTEKNAILHLIATNQPDFLEQIGFGMEERVVTSLYTDKNNEAYWQRIELGCYIPGAEFADPRRDEYKAEEEAKAKHIAEMLSHVPMIRNFCRVSVNNLEADFQVTGLYVLNTVDRGTVVPYVAGNEPGHRFVNYYKEGDDGSPYVGLSYREISNQNHVGTMPSDMRLINTSKNPDEIATKSLGENVKPVYFYERPAQVNSSQRTYVIIRGKLRQSNGSFGNESFYKLDLGYLSDAEGFEDIGLFEYYNLLRNFDYVINITNVESDGYSSFEKAANGVVFNNFSATVEARSMKSVSDGTDMIFVNYTSFVFTQDNMELDLQAQYRTDITNTNRINNGLLKIKWAPGDVIKNITGPTPTTDTEDGTTWNSYKVYGNNPDDRPRQQTVYIYRGNKGTADKPEYGLYRVITFFAHTPWKFKNMDTYPGLWESFDELPPWDWSNQLREIGQSKGAPLTLFFELPDGLPQAIFPLEFVIESDRQNIQNAYQGNAVVQSVAASKSLFYNHPTSIGRPTTARIQYVKTVTWENYSGEGSNEEIGKNSAIIRCRFLTITDLNQDIIGGGSTQSETTLRVYNKYFGKYENGVFQDYQDDGFTRDTRTSDPSPRNWDFSTPYWDSFMDEMNSRYDKTFDYTSDRYIVYTGSNNNIDGLIFIDGGEPERITLTNKTQFDVTKPTLISGTSDKGLRYVETTNLKDTLKTKMVYSNDQERTMRLTVMSTDTFGITKEPKISFTGLKGVDSMPAPEKAVCDTTAYPTYSYEYTVPKALTGVDVNITSPDGDNMRIYKIEFYPRWDTFQK